MRSLLRIVDAVAVVGGIPAAVIVAILAWTQHLPDPGQDWGLKALGPMGTMAGFTLASLAIIIGSARTSPQIEGLLGSPPGNALIGALLASLWSWAFAALFALLYWVSGGHSLAWAGFAASSSLGAWYGARALLWISVTFRRFRGTKSRGP